jgi:hypothetical protein
MEDGGTDAAAGKRQTNAMESRLRGSFRGRFVRISRPADHRLPPQQGCCGFRSSPQRNLQFQKAFPTNWNIDIIRTDSTQTREPRPRYLYMYDGNLRTQDMPSVFLPATRYARCLNF